MTTIRSKPGQLPKLCGADIELGNFILGGDHGSNSAALAARTLLAELRATDHCVYADGMGRRGPGAYVSDSYRPGNDPQDWGRTYLHNAACAYIDLDHLELCVPECLSAWDHVACWHALLQIARSVLRDANARRHDGSRIELLANNSDGRGHSFGSHTNFLITRTAWDNLFGRKLHHLLWLAAFQASSIVFTGAGKVGSENDAPPVAFQLAQRADFFETLTGEQTTYRRPLVNSRDEPLCGIAPQAEQGFARLHSIFFDNTVCFGSALLRTGTMQIALAMLEAERVSPQLILDDPVAAVGRWSHDPTLRARCRLASGRHRTAVELQLQFFEEAQRFVHGGGCRGIVPRADEIIELWGDTLQKLQHNDLHALAGRLDWVLKFTTLQRALLRHSALTWSSPEIKHLDFLYSSLGDDGLFWHFQRAGIVEAHVASDRIAHFVSAAPDDTRAWTRAQLMRIAGGAVDGAGWDMVRVRVDGERGWPVYRTIHLSNPLAFTRAEIEPIITRAASLDELLDLLTASPPEIDTAPTLYGWH